MESVPRLPPINKAAEGNEQSYEEELSVETKRLLKRADIKLNCINTLLHQARSYINEDRSASFLLQKLQQLEKNKTQLDQLHEEILMEVPDEQQGTPYFVQQHYEEIGMRIDEMTVEIQEYVEQKSTRKVIHTEQRGDIQVIQAEIKLPPIEIPCFNGQYRDWSAFHDRFSRFVHENKTLSDTHKISYLKSYVKGEAAKLLSHITTTGSNYMDAWNILVNRYNNKRLLVTTHVNVLLNLPTIMSESAAAIRQLHDTIMENLYAINNLGINTTTWNALLIPLILRKIDSETHRLYEVNLEKPREIQPLDEFLKFLEGRFQSLEASNTTKRSQQIRVTTTRPNPDSIQPPRRTFIGVTKLCIACNGSHELTRCSTFIKMQVLERSRLVAANNLCRICLKSSHSKYPCNSKESCVVCKGNHNTLLHTKEVSTSLHSAKKQNNAPNGVPLLATALVNAANRIGYAVRLRTLIDPGSQSSFITQEAADRLNLPKFRVDLHVTGIGGMKTNNIKYKVNVSISPRFSSTFNQVVEAFILPKLTEKLPSEPIKGVNNNPIKELILADPNFENPAPVDMILGADIYANIIVDGVIKNSPCQPVAQKTELGWILLGVTTQPNLSSNASLSLITQNSLERVKELKSFDNPKQPRN